MPTSLGSLSLAALALAAAALAGCGTAGEPGGGPDSDAAMAEDLPGTPDATPDPRDPGTADDGSPDTAVPGDADAAGPGDEGTDEGTDAAADADPGPPPPDPALRLRAEGWRTGDLHLHTTYSDGEDSVEVVVALAEYLQSPEFLAFHPEYVGNPADFIALTDHREVAQNSDPAFRSDRVILVPGEEFGSPGHAGTLGVTSFVPHDPGGDGSDLADYAGGVDIAHGQGAVFSMNHPCTPKIPFPWDIRTHDALEVWNTRWGLQGAPVSPARLAEWEAANGPASPAFRRAVQVQDEAGSGQALRFYEAQLTLGLQVALVGGSDRHTLFPVGFPATWVQAPTRDAAGVVEGIRRRHTFVSRTPASAIVEMAVDVGGNTWGLGDAIPVPDGGAEATVTLRVGRADRGRVRLVRGVQAAGDEALADTPLGQVVHEAAVEGDDFTTTVDLVLHPGDWFYPVVHERLVPEGLDPEVAATIPAKAAALATYSEDNFAPIIDALLDYMDLDVVLAPENCDPAAWIATDAQCLPADRTGMASFFFPDWIDRLFNVVTEGGAIGDWTMGAVGSAARCVTAPARGR